MARVRQVSEWFDALDASANVDTDDFKRLVYRFVNEYPTFIASGCADGVARLYRVDLF